MAASTDPAKLYFRLLTEIGIVSQLSIHRLERVLPEGMSAAQFGVLNHFVRLGGQWSPGRLARAFQVTKGAMTNTLQRLEGQGWVRVIADPGDARAKLVELTPAGRKAQAKAVAAAGRAMTEVIARVPVHDVELALPILERLRKVLDELR